MRITEDPVGRKLIMTATGLGMTAFVAVHLLGNAALFAGAGVMNAYANALQGFGPFIWTVRLGLAAMVVLHVYFGVQLSLENRKAKPDAYAVIRNSSSTVAGRNIFWVGLLLGSFIIYHLLHFTLQVLEPGISAAAHPDASGRPDVYGMVVGGFGRLHNVAVYLLAMGLLGLHLMHGVQSSFQTMGLNSERSFPFITRTGLLFALLIFFGFASFPLAVYSGFLR